MDVENHVYPPRSRVEALLADDSADPVVMLNLLKFRKKAVYADGRASDLTGREAYNLYGVAMQKIIEDNGGQMLFGGDIASVVIGEVGDLWDTCRTRRISLGRSICHDRGVAGGDGDQRAPRRRTRGSVADPHGSARGHLTS